MKTREQGYIYAILAAILFGVSTPAAKLLLGIIDPWLLAGILYLGSAIGLFIVFSLQRFLKQTTLNEAALKYRDWKWLLCIIFIGGILGPVFLMIGLTKVPASSASLFLNLESVFTALLAWFVFNEYVDYKIALGMLSIVIGSLILSWKGNLTQNIQGPMLIAGACLCWAIDNNLTRKISGSNPVQIAMIKSFIAGLINTSFAVFYGLLLPDYLILFTAGTIGFISYGLSLILFIFGLRYIGAARTGAYFSLAPFVGASFAIAFLEDSISTQFILASAFMGIGSWLHLTEYHSHEHQHEELQHEHTHVHDEHHQHNHLLPETKKNPYSHLHQHKSIRHKHPHYPDIHHRHKH
jgi:drug/metabolite transporter (DMT)-like permease